MNRSHVRIHSATSWVCGLLLASLAGFPAWADGPFWATVLRVLDGDTLEVRLKDGDIERIRLEGIDCPEHAQPHGLDARMATAQMVEGGIVSLMTRDRDRYGRMIAQVHTPDGRSVNERLVEAGHCWWFRPYAPNNHRLEQLEAEARARRRGLWNQPHPTPPWEWRKHNRTP